MKKLNLGILISGNGSNLQAIIDNIENGKLNAEIKIVISDNKDAYGLERAKKSEINFCYIDPGKYKTKLDDKSEKKYIECLKSNNVELVCLAGFMRIIKKPFLDVFLNKVINIHPSLLPAFPGLYSQKQAILYGVKFSGATVHFVDEGTDTGPIIIQEVVPVYENDTEEELKCRILKQEHKIYSEAIKLIADDKIKIQGRKIIDKC